MKGVVSGTALVDEPEEGAGKARGEQMWGEGGKERGDGSRTGEVEAEAEEREEVGMCGFDGRGKPEGRSGTVERKRRRNGERAWERRDGKRI